MARSSSRAARRRNHACGAVIDADSGGYSNGANAPDPRGTTVTFVYAKINGVWTEPQNVCVAVRFHDSEPHNRYVAFGLWNTAGFFLDLTGARLLPARRSPAK